MNVIALYASARRRGFSALAVDHACTYLEAHGAEVEKFRLTEMDIKQCRGCFACRRKEVCSLRDDMTGLYDKIVAADLVIFSSPVYCFDVSATFKLMFERLYPMLDGGMALGEGFKKYELRHPGKKCLAVLSMGALQIMCRSVRKSLESNLKHNGFDNLGTIVIDGTYNRKQRKLTAKEIRRIENACAKALGT